MKIDHIAIYTKKLDRLKAFYEYYFGGISNTKYKNKTTGLETYFISFQDGTRLEIMTRPVLDNNSRELFHTGYIHIAFSVGSIENVNMLTQKLEEDGYPIISYPRTTGDGYYESCVLDPDGNQIEITT